MQRAILAALKGGLPLLISNVKMLSTCDITATEPPAYLLIKKLIDE